MDDCDMTKSARFYTHMHSIIYEPKLRDNEERSADLFMGFAAEALTEVCSVRDRLLFLISLQALILQLKNLPNTP